METEQNPESVDSILKKNKNFLTILFIVGVGIFYWTQIHPTDIRKNCAISAENEATTMCQQKQAEYPGLCVPTYGTSTTYHINDYNQQYASCLAENGL